MAYDERVIEGDPDGGNGEDGQYGEAMEKACGGHFTELLRGGSVIVLRTSVLALLVVLILAACSVGGADRAEEDVASEADRSPSEDERPTESPRDAVDDSDKGATETPRPTDDPEESDPSPTPAETGEAALEPDEVTESPSPSPEKAGEDEGALPAEWQQDSSGDGVPNFIMAELGWDPDEAWCDLSPEFDCPGLGPAGSVGRPGETAIMLMLDSSGSMADEVSDGQKMDLAKEAVEYFAVATPSTTDLGFLVFGHEGSMDPADHEVSCAGVEVLAELGEADHESVPPLLEEFSPTGFTPLAQSLETAGEAFEGRDGQDNRVLLVSDGLETCDGDPAAQAVALHQSGIGLVVDVIAYDVPQEEHEALQAIAEAGGGTFRFAGSGEELFTVVRASIQEGLARGNCILDAAFEQANCLEEREPELGAALETAVDGGGYSVQQEREMWDHVDDLADDVDDDRANLQEFFTTELCQIASAESELRERVQSAYGDDLSENYDLVDEQLQEHLGDDVDDRNERLEEAGAGLNC